VAKFIFSAIKDGKTINSVVEATDRSSAIGTIKSQGYRLINLEEQVESKRTGFSFGFKKKVKSDELVMFTRQLSAMVSAGVPILRSLNSLSRNAENPNFKKALASVSKDVEGGSSLADSLAKHPAIFSDVYVNMVRAGESAGILDDILKRLALQQEKSASIRKKIKSAMTYPIVLIFITIIAFFGLMLFVIPSIGKTIKDIAGEEAELPVLTQVMLGISQFFISYWFIVFPLIIGAVWLLLRYIKTPKGKRRFHQIILKLPAVNTIVKKVAIANFTRTFSALIGAGVAVLEALDVTSRAIGNVIYKESLQKAAERVKGGEVLSKIIAEDEELYPAIVSQMLLVGEETGQTDQVLVKVADFYEDEVDTAIAGISSTIEPVMIVIMGSMVGVIAASVIMPITGLAQQIKT